MVDDDEEDDASFGISMFVGFVVAAPATKDDEADEFVQLSATFESVRNRRFFVFY